MIAQSLNGSWRMQRAGDDAWLDAVVPGSVYADLLRAGRLEDPFYRENEQAAFDVMREDYVYTRSFSVDEALLACDAVLLRCEGLDTLCDVSVNGEAVASADNMHRTWEWDVKDMLRAGENEVRILFRSPLRYILAENEARPCWGTTDATPGFSHLRKAHCMFGWDWGPRLPDAGIWRDISLLGVEMARIDSVYVGQLHEDGRVILSLEPELDAYMEEEMTLSATVTAPDGRVYRPKDDESLNVVIGEPMLWWPAGYGNQPLYTVRVELSKDEKLLDVWERRIGLRTLTVSREKDEWGEEFCHVINGVKIFAMGGDYIPEDNILSRVTPERTRRLLEDAKLAHFNTVRVWGGGYYPDDFFFDICDELGLLVWQDFMYACAFYDLTEDFEESITQEAIDNVLRLRHHASLALLCGNNEMEMFQKEAADAVRAGQSGFGVRRPSHMADYTKMFEYIIPNVVKAYAPQTFYWPASPSSGGAFDEPNDPNRGDVHYWDVWHGEKPFTEYRKFHFRYASEFGFQSFPCLETVKSFTLPEDRNIFSRVMERHQRNRAANGKILSYLSQTYRYPESFDNLLYASQLLQADAIRYGVEHWRRFRGRCMGAIIWQLNDCWPVASWSSIDYYGRWKALHYAAKRFFAPVMLSCCEEGEITQNPQINEFHPGPIERSITLCVANETRFTVHGIVRWALRTPDGAVVREGAEEIEVPALSSRWLKKLCFEEASLTANYASFSFEQDGKAVSCGTALFCAPKHFAFMDPKLALRLEGDEVVVTACAFARYVQIESEDADLLLSDNFFDMNAGERRVKVLRGSAKQLRARSVYDL